MVEGWSKDDPGIKGSVWDVNMRRYKRLKTPRYRMDEGRLRDKRLTSGSSYTQNPAKRKAGAKNYALSVPCTTKYLQINRGLSTPIYFTAFTNSSDETFACLRILRNVPIATSLCIGTTQPTVPSGVDFFITTWLPR